MKMKTPDDMRKVNTLLASYNRNFVTSGKAAGHSGIVHEMLRPDSEAGAV